MWICLGNTKATSRAVSPRGNPQIGPLLRFFVRSLRPGLVGRAGSWRGGAGNRRQQSQDTLARDRFEASSGREWGQLCTVHCVAAICWHFVDQYPLRARGRARASARKAERQAEIHRMILSSGSLIRQTTTTVIPSDEREDKRIERMKGASPAACRVFRSLHLIITTFPTFTAAAHSCYSCDNNDEAVAPPKSPSSQFAK